MKQSHFTIIALLLLGFAFAAIALFYNTGQEQLNNGSSESRSEALIRDHSVTAGNPAAKVTIVEFMDPACETCAQFHPFVKRLMNAWPEKLTWWFVMHRFIKARIKW